MSARTRNLLTLAALVWLAVTARLAFVLPLPTVNVLLAVAVVPLVWVVLAFCHWSATHHATRYARDVDKVHAGRPVPVPERAP
jgi:uncharacterized membrane protein YhaH (DUF805 family)